MPKQILIIQGHPDPQGGHFCHALADAYAEGALRAGHVVKRVAVADVEFPILRTRQEWESADLAPAIRDGQELLGRAEHIVIVYPLWMGGMPALLKGYFEQVLRPGFAIKTETGKTWTRLLKGKTAHIVVTMGMPAWLYRWFFGAHSLKSLERNILRLVGIKPVRESLVGTVEASAPKRNAWLARMREFGARGG